MHRCVRGRRSAAGARRGEFTRRAFLAGKLDLLQAEAIGDLIDARSQRPASGGAASSSTAACRAACSRCARECLQLEALLAYDIDFPEEDDGPIAPARIAEAVDRVMDALDALLATAPAVPLLREGAIVVLAGVPNAGKSSLFNALLGEARAIVTRGAGHHARCARGHARYAGRADPAGGHGGTARDTPDAIEQLGIEVSRAWLARAHVVLACGATPEEVAQAVAAVTSRTPAALIVRVLTKQDAGARRSMRGAVHTSAETGAGLAELLEAIGAVIEAHGGHVPAEVPRLTRERHHVAVRTARDELAAFREAWQEGAGTPAIIAAVHVRAAVTALEDLIGVLSLDDVLDRVFSDFCVGK